MQIERQPANQRSSIRALREAKIMLLMLSADELIDAVRLRKHLQGLIRPPGRVRLGGLFDSHRRWPCCALLNPTAYRLHLGILQPLSFLRHRRRFTFLCHDDFQQIARIRLTRNDKLIFIQIVNTRQGKFSLAVIV